MVAINTIIMHGVMFEAGDGHRSVNAYTEKQLNSARFPRRSVKWWSLWAPSSVARSHCVMCVYVAYRSQWASKYRRARRCRRLLVIHLTPPSTLRFMSVDIITARLDPYPLNCCCTQRPTAHVFVYDRPNKLNVCLCPVMLTSPEI